MNTHAGQQFGNYRLIRLLGQGGFAEVYLGEHVHLNTPAAIKVLEMRLIGSGLEIFRNEARVIAGLVHPNIVRLMDFGVERGVPFLVMEYAAYGTMCQCFPEGQPIPVSRLVPYVKQIAAALQYAHDRKLIHRDVKPENMLLGSNEHLLLSDFGLVTIAHSTQSQTTKEMAGTIAYTAPEQLNGKPQTMSDQYALAVTVYEWLSGAQLFRGSFVEIAGQHLNTPPAPLVGSVPGVSPQIEAVVMRALSKDPHQRFSHVQDFADALEQASAPGESLVPSPLQQFDTAGPTTPLSQSFLPTFVRTPTPASAPPAQQVWEQIQEPQSPAPLVSVFATAPTGDVMDTPGRVERQGECTPTPVPVSAPHVSRTMSRRAALGLGLGIAGLASAGAVLWMVEGSRIFGPPVLHHGITPTPTVAKKPARGTILLTYSGHQQEVRAVAWSRDGKHIASGGDDREVQIWEAATGARVYTYRGYLAHTDADVDVIAWSPDGKRIASSLTYGNPTATVQILPDVRVWDASTGQQIVSYPGHLPRIASHSNYVPDLSWSPDGKYLVSAGGYDKTAQVWDAATGETLVTYRGHSADVLQARWSPDGTRIASVGKLDGIQVWDTRGNPQVSRPDLFTLAWSPDGKKLVSNGTDSHLHIWDVATGQDMVQTPSRAWLLSWSPNSTLIAAASDSLTSQTWDVELYDARSGQVLYTYQSTSVQINALAWSSDSQRLAMGGVGIPILIWQAG